MIYQEDNMGFVEQLRDTLYYIDDNEQMVQREMNQININLKILEEKKKKIQKSISSFLVDNVSEDVYLLNMNDSDLKVADLKNEKQRIEKEIKEEEEKFLECIKRKNNLENIKNCFYTLKGNLCEETYDIHKDTFEGAKGNDKISYELGLSIIETQENERKRIARDLHDSTVQNLTTMMHKTELCTRLIDIDPVRAKLELQTMVGTIKTTINDMRNIIYGLRPMTLDDLGLIPAIEKYIRDVSNNYNIKVKLKIHNKERQLLPSINLTLFRIIQESVNNSIKHGKANGIWVDIYYCEKAVRVQVRDDGIGISNDTLNKASGNIFSGYGLSMMKERVSILSGNFNIESKEKEGTKIEVKIPLINIRRGNNE
ncbi:sensor histidine kinase [Anaerocolumna xylanovorans]|uniref:Oxygen sensor histidine kinase NreB n=1 Tax=Anaerocolumna xylanovorans DSM 12503 TaxID=1121345 RepID=A0A1M7YNQ1_9FIRM|nr:sensor histidine kinase [Anaerocolumna xylanovorans]SHO54262.1 two-component system, NarL family, sensor histidine kinase DegS [Anaerocolumna xylanovorans DSM 12503]